MGVVVSFSTRPAIGRAGGVICRGAATAPRLPGTGRERISLTGVWNWLAVAVSLLCCAGCARRGSQASDIVPATLAAQPAISYPPELYASRIEGEVMLYLVVDSSGAPLRDSTRVARSSGHAAFDAAALEAASTLRFTPAHRGAVAVTAAIQIPIRFTLPDSLKHLRDHL
jgi:TonB family protein